MAVLNWEIENKAYDEVNLGSKTYRLYFDDKSLERYQKQAQKYTEEAEQFAEVDASKLTEKEQQEMKDKSNLIAKEFIETFFGEGSFDEIFEACGGSSFNLIHVVNNVMDWLQAKYAPIEKQKQAMYQTKR